MPAMPFCGVPGSPVPRRVPVALGILVGFVTLALGGCSPSASSSHGPIPRAFSRLADCFFRGTADHHGKSLSPAEAHSLAANPFGISLRLLRTLDADAARELAACRGFLHFAVLPTLCPTAAAELARHAEDLRFDRLETLSADTARGLARHAGAIHLNGLRSIDRATAEALATHDGMLALNGLEAPEEEVILALVTGHRGHLCLNGLTSLTPAAAEALTKRRGKASLNGLVSLTYQSLGNLIRGSASSAIDLPDWIPMRSDTGLAIGPGPAPEERRGEPVTRRLHPDATLASAVD